MSRTWLGLKEKMTEWLMIDERHVGVHVLCHTAVFSPPQSLHPCILSLLCVSIQAAWWMWLHTEFRHAQQRIIFLPLPQFSPLPSSFYVYFHVWELFFFSLLSSQSVFLSPPFPSRVRHLVSRPPCLNSINSQRTLFASEYQSACVCVWVLYLCRQTLSTLCKCVHVCNVWRCLHMSTCVRACKFCALLFSLFPCSCAPLNMSDVLERDITTRAEREASSLSSPSPLYITSYWHQSLFILPSPHPSLSLILFPSLCLYFLSCISAFHFSLFFFPALYPSPLVAICRVVRLFQFGSAHCFTDGNTSMVRTL